MVRKIIWQKKGFSDLKNCHRKSDKGEQSGGARQSLVSISLGMRFGYVKSKETIRSVELLL